MNRLMGTSGSTWRSSQIPASPGVIRPSGETAVASAITKAAPPAARAPRWTRCQSVARPSSDEYMHMGETPMRLRSVTDLSVNGSNRCGIKRIHQQDRRTLARVVTIFEASAAVLTGNRTQRAWTLVTPASLNLWILHEFVAASASEWKTVHSLALAATAKSKI